MELVRIHVPLGAGIGRGLGRMDTIRGFQPPAALARIPTVDVSVIQRSTTTIWVESGSAKPRPRADRNARYRRCVIESVIRIPSSRFGRWRRCVRRKTTDE